jgi:hypothetical protein
VTVLRGDYLSLPNGISSRKIRLKKIAESILA